MLSRGKHGPPYPMPPVRYLRPMRVSRPIARLTTSTSAPGSSSHSAAIVFANVIFIVTYVFTAIFASSAFTSPMRSTGGALSQ